jgi:2-polyprenyl-6-methoxyphenol hydroxylase-like FAD-dependent oxidoreductase
MQMTTVDFEEVDVLIAGGGVAGSATAAALAQLGLSVLIAEPDPDHGRRLAGELIHPPGIDGLCELGLLSEETAAGKAVRGFAIFPFKQEQGTESVLLPYGEMQGRVRSGLAIEHRLLKDHLLDTVKDFPGVRVWLGTRVTDMQSTDERRYVAVVRRDDREILVKARLIVGADGPMSQLRKMVGIAHATQRYSGMMGLEVEDTHLPHPGYGNIFLNPAGVSYAYGIAEGRARVMFEVLRGDDPKESISAHLSLFPEAFRADIEAVMAAEKPLAAANYCIVPEASVKGNVALVGDARGCCHPLTASGITAAVKDALILRDALRESNLDFAAALRRYSLLCGRLQLTRRTLAEELREAFLAQTPEASLLNQCIFRYWRHNPSGRTHSMALLSTLDSSFLSLATQYVLVAFQAFRLLPEWVRNRSLLSWNKGVFWLLRKSLSFQHAALSHRLKELRAPVA